MAERRMLSKTIMNSDNFLELPIGSRLLYYDLVINADDDGFTNSVKRTMLLDGTNQDDLDALIKSGFIIRFESGVCAIRHWNLHNHVQKDRYKETIFTDEKSQLIKDENKVYTECIQDVSNMETQDSIEENSIVKISEEKNSEGEISKEKNNAMLMTQDNITYKEIIDYLNLKAGTDYKWEETSTQDLIKDLLSKEYTIDDFKTVIDKKTYEWKNTEMEKYLRPYTLFGEKFENYLGQIVPMKKRTLKDIPMKEIDRLIEQSKSGEIIDNDPFAIY